MAADPLPDTRRFDPFTVGGWLAEPRACRLSRGDTTVKLRPQLMDLLVCLARRPGDIVLKDEILAEVWASQYIAESGLSRCVAELRQHLGDDAHGPHFIETIPKRGYRLVAPVAWLPGDSGATAVTGAAEAAPGTGRDDPAPRAEPASAGAPAQTAPAAVSRGLLARHWRLATLAGVTLAVAVLTIVGVLSTGGWGGRALITERDTVMLADLANTTGDAVFDDALRLALGVNLGQAPFLRILPREAVRAALVRAGRPPDDRVTGAVALDVCRREGAAVLLAASIAPLGTSYAIGIEAVACDTGEEVWRTIEHADRKETVLAALERAATSARRTLGETRESLRQHRVPLVSATTPSLDALKALTLGDDAREHSRLDEAASFYRRATELDPQFALAWARLGVALKNVGRTEDCAPALRRAYALADRVSPPERFYITAHYHRNVTGDVDQALETYRAWRRLYPGSFTPPLNAASILVEYFGRYDEALPDALDSLRREPFSSLCANVVVWAYRGLNRVGEAVAVLDDMERRDSMDRILRVHRIELAFGAGDAAAVERESRGAEGDPLSEMTAYALRAVAATSSGRLREGRRWWAAAVAPASALGPAGVVADVRAAEALAEAVAGDPVGAGGRGDGARRRRRARARSSPARRDRHDAARRTGHDARVDRRRPRARVRAQRTGRRGAVDPPAPGALRARAGVRPGADLRARARGTRGRPHGRRRGDLREPHVPAHGQPGRPVRARRRSRPRARPARRRRHGGRASGLRRVPRLVGGRGPGRAAARRGHARARGAPALTPAPCASIAARGAISPYSSNRPTNPVAIRPHKSKGMRA